MEEWKDIKGYEGLYQVSNLGNIRRIKFVNNIVSKYKITNIKPQKNNSGYSIVMLSKNGKSHPKTIHRIVANHFIDNPYNLPQINHINGNKDDCRVENLEWVSMSDNLKHSYKIGLRSPSSLGLFGENNKKAIKINMFDKQGNFIKTFGSIIDGAKFIGLDSSCHIVSCCKGKLKSAYNYIWQEIDCEPICDYITANIEVIGNIYDNPELLEVKDED